MTTELEVFLGEAMVGHLVETSPQLWSFVYADTAHAPGYAGPISIALPRIRGAHHGDPVRAVFAHLLPDGALRRRLARSVGVSQNNDFALLARVGRECAGALRLRSPASAWRSVPEQRVLGTAELRNLVAVLPVHPLLAEADGLSKTLNGEFDKLPVRLSAGQVRVVLGDELTSHIIKPAKPGLRESVMNEAYCMQLAEAWGLPVAGSEVVHGAVSVLAVARVDRRGDEVVEPIHMEDFCQALGYPPPRIYEREGGPRLAEIGALIRRVSTCPALDLRALVRWTVFSFLIGFGAGHGKQLALLHGPRGPRLAPFFGLWSTHVYPEMNHRMGLRIGHEDRPDWLSAARWSEFAEAIGVRPRYVLDLLGEGAAALPRLSAKVAEEFHRKNGFAEITRGVRTLIEQRARQVLVSLEAEQPGPVRRRDRA